MEIYGHLRVANSVRFLPPQVEASGYELLKVEHMVFCGLPCCKEDR